MVQWKKAEADLRAEGMKKLVKTTSAILLCLLAITWIGIHVNLTGRGPSDETRTTPSTQGVPVTAGVAGYSDVPIYLSGLGTVQASNSVLIKSQVDGQILKFDVGEGQEVHAGDIVAEIDPRSYAAALAQAKALKLKDQAQLGNAQLDLRRYQGLVANDSISHQQVDTQAALVDQYQGAVSADQAQIDLAQVQLGNCILRSPIDGRAGTRLVDSGNIVRATDTTGIVTINQIRPILVRFALPADSLPEVRAEKQQGNVAVIADDGNGRELATGALTVIDNQINTSTATITFKASFDNVDEVLWPGQFVNIRLLLQVRRKALIVPVTAVVRDSEGAYVFVISPDRIAQKRRVKIGFTNDAIAIVDSGLAAADQVVTDGQYRIETGSHVDASESRAGYRASPLSSAAIEAPR